MIILDTGVIVAAADRRDANHAKAKRLFQRVTEPLALSPFVLAEADYLLVKLVGPAAELEFLKNIEEGALSLERFTSADVGAARAIIDRYRDLKIGLADASIVVLAERLGTRRVATFDHRHFGALRTPRGHAFELLP